MNIGRGKVAWYKLHGHTTKAKVENFLTTMTTIVFSSPIPSLPLFIMQETISY